MSTRWNSLLILLFIVLVATLLGLPLAACIQVPAPIPEPTKIEDGWVRLRIEDIGSIDYPADFLEVQSADYRYLVKETSPNLAALVFRLGKSDFILQQVGLNELKPSAVNEYRRVMFSTDYLNPGEEVFRANEKYAASRQELAELQNEFMNQLRQEYAKLNSMGLGNTKIIDSGSLEIMEINGMFPLVRTFKRQLNDNPVVLVKTYSFWNYDKTHLLTLSCRVADEAECTDIYEKILYSFRLR